MTCNSPVFTITAVFPGNRPKLKYSLYRFKHAIDFSIQGFNAKGNKRYEG